MVTSKHCKTGNQHRIVNAQLNIEGVCIFFKGMRPECTTARIQTGALREVEHFTANLVKFLDVRFHIAAVTADKVKLSELCEQAKQAWGRRIGDQM